MFTFLNSRVQQWQATMAQSLAKLGENSHCMHTFHYVDVCQEIHFEHNLWRDEAVSEIPLEINALNDE